MAVPKGKLLALVAAFLAIGLVAGTGAFTTVSADRTATVNVAGDDSALLQFNPVAPYAEVSNGGQLTIDLTSTSEGAQGLNPNAETTFAELFSVTNQGTQSVNVSISIDASSAPSGSIDSVEVYNASAGSTTSNFDEELSAGGTSSRIGLYFDTGDNLSGDFDITITVEADQSEGYDA